MKNDKNRIANFFKGKDVLVTGGCGSIGSAIVRELLKYKTKRVRSFDNNEYGQFRLGEELKDYRQLRLLMGDIRDKNRLVVAMKGVNIVVHAAALKHVSLSEYNPYEAVATNVYGTQNVLESAREAEVEKVIFISTDKAVRSTSTMGVTKFLAEKLVMNAHIGKDKTVYSCVRFGNVLNSSGSVIPIFRQQIAEGKPVTLTSREMTRFFMTIPDAVNLILKATMLAKGREIFILKMKAMRISDIAEIMIERNHGKSSIKMIGIRPGEKLHEALMTKEETHYANDIDGMFIIKPRLNVPHYIEKSVSHANSRIFTSSLSSKNCVISKAEAKKLLESALWVVKSSRYKRVGGLNG